MLSAPRPGHRDRRYRTREYGNSSEHHPDEDFTATARAYVRPPVGSTEREAWDLLDQEERDLVTAWVLAEEQGTLGDSVLESFAGLEEERQGLVLLALGYVYVEGYGWRSPREIQADTRWFVIRQAIVAAVVVTFVVAVLWVADVLP